MKYAILVVDFANGVPCPIAGQYLKSFDHDALDGLGHGVFTYDPAEAMRFDSVPDVLEFWRKTSAVKPVREDGKPNRPLSATTITIEPVR